MAADITTWGQVKEALRELKDPEVKGMYNTIVIDTVDKAAQLCEKYICNQLGIENIGDGGWATNSWKKVKLEWEQTFNSLAMMGYSIIFISHSKEKPFKRKDGTEYSQIVPSCSNAYNEIIRNMVDIEGYIDVNDGARTLVLRSPDDTVECKSRFKYMAPTIPFSYNDLVEAMNTAIDKEAAERNGDFVTNERETSAATAIEYDYDALMNEFNAIAGKLMGKDGSYYGPRITQIVSKILGKGKKVSDTTREQAEFIYLIVGELKDEFASDLA